MTLSPQNKRILLLGPGALGSAFATSLGLSHKVTLLGGQVDPRSFQWQNAPINFDSTALLRCDWIPQTEIKAPDFVQQKLCNLDQERSIFLFSFLPTGQEQVTFETYNKISQKYKNCVLCFCSNGLVPSNLLDNFQSCYPDRPVFRLLFYAGFGRNKETKSLRYFGGNKVVMGDFMNQLGSPKILADMLSNQDNEGNSWPIFKYVFSDSIKQDEIEKLFVNWTIAISAGPNLTTNLQASQQIDSGTLNSWAGFFELALLERCDQPNLGQPNPIPVDSLKLRFLRSFKETTQETAQNINSFSRAFVQGDPSPFEELWSTVVGIRQGISAYRPADLAEVDLFFERISKTWSVGKFPWK